MPLPNFWAGLAWLEVQVRSRDERSALVPRTPRDVPRTRSPSDGDGGERAPARGAPPEAEFFEPRIPTPRRCRRHEGGGGVQSVGERTQMLTKGTAEPMAQGASDRLF